MATFIGKDLQGATIALGGFEQIEVREFGGASQLIGRNPSQETEVEIAVRQAQPQIPNEPPVEAKWYYQGVLELVSQAVISDCPPQEPCPE